jgi:translation initiation factor 4B
VCTFLRFSLLNFPTSPAKERSGSSEDSKFENPWRRDGPLSTRDSSRRPHEAPPGERHPARLADETSDWRSSRANRAVESEGPPFKRKGSGFAPSDGQLATADKEDTWSIGSKFRPSTDGSHDEAQKFASIRAKGDMGPPKEIPSDEPDWRSARPKPARGSVSRKFAPNHVCCFADRYL